MRILLIRHGLTALGEEKRYQGSTDTPLSDAGRLVLQPDDRFARVYCSPLLRAAETAEILFPSAEKRMIPDLREMDFGAFESRGWWEMEHDPAYRAWVAGNCVGKCPGGEDRAGFTARVQAAFSALVEQERCAGASELVIVAHGGTQMAALSRWGMPQKDYFAWQTPCACGWLLEDANWPERLHVIKEVSFVR